MSITFRPLVNAGSLDVGKGACSLLIIGTTSGTISQAFLDTKKANVNESQKDRSGRRYPIVGSIKSKFRSSLHNSQA
ncbi:hypothetical protein SLA2020_366610 [Shorea laevis]